MPVDLSDLIRMARQADTKIVTARYNEWLLQHGDDPMRPDLAQLVADQLAKPPRVRSGTFSASSSGVCLRAQELGYLGVPSDDLADPRLQLIFTDGHWRHLRWQITGLEAGIFKRMEVPLRWRRHKSFGTVDAAGVVPDDHPHKPWRGKTFGFELKGMNTWQFKRLVQDHQQTLPVKHQNQIDRYLLMSGWPLFSYVVEDKSTQEWLEWIVEPDAKRMAQQELELRELNRAIDQGTLHPVLPSCQIKKGLQYRGCPWGRDGNDACMKAGTWPKIK